MEQTDLQQHEQDLVQCEIHGLLITKKKPTGCEMEITLPVCSQAHSLSNIGVNGIRWERRRQRLATGEEVDAYSEILPKNEYARALACLLSLLQSA